MIFQITSKRRKSKGRVIFKSFLLFTMEYLKDMWWHQCNDFHGSLWLSKGVNKCCHCGFKKLEMSGDQNEL